MECMERLILITCMAMQSTERMPHVQHGQSAAALLCVTPGVSPQVLDHIQQLCMLLYANQIFLCVLHGRWGVGQVKCYGIACPIHDENTPCLNQGRKVYHGAKYDLDKTDTRP